MKRLESIDVLRGAAMVIMALDHVRDFISDARFEPTDLDKTNAALFLTRWITHFCAPVFVFLAGTGAFLSLGAGKPKSKLAWFLLTRGVWLIVLEVTFVRFGWTFNFSYGFIGVQVIWAIGWSMIMLAPLVFLPAWAVGAFGVAMIAVHNLLDGVHFREAGVAHTLWTVLHDPGPTNPMAFRSPDATPIIFVAYPLIPWIGVMAAGYAFGALLGGEAGRRRRLLLVLGGTMILLFVALRASKLYGDASPWLPEEGVLSFLNCTKYPPSLLYLLMTLGPAILALGLLDRATPFVLRPLIVFGRVPLFYYLLHLVVIHSVAIACGYARYGEILPTLLSAPFGEGTPPYPKGYGYALGLVYVVWLGVVLFLYLPCRWFAGVKSRSKNVLLSYL